MSATAADAHLVPEVRPAQSHHQRIRSDSTSIELAAQEDFNEGILSEERKEEARKRNSLQWKILLALILPNFLAAVDVTIVAPAIPLISAHFSKFESQ